MLLLGIVLVFGKWYNSFTSSKAVGKEIMKSDNDVENEISPECMHP